MATYYARTKFKADVNEAGVTTKFIMPGDTVSKDKLGVDDAEWDYLVETGAVSTEKYPDLPDGVSPAEAEREARNISIVEELVHEQTSPTSLERDSEDEATRESSSRPPSGAK